MRKFCSAAVASTFFFFSSSIPKATFADEVSTNTSDLGFFMAEDPTLVNSGGDATTNLYKLSSSGVVTLLQQDVFPDVSTNTFTSSDFTVDESQGKIYFLEPDRGGGAGKRYRKYDIESNEFEGYINVSGLPSGATPINMGVINKLNDTVEKKCVSTDSDCDDTDDTKFVSLGGSGTDELIRVDSDGISTGGSSSKSLVKYVGDELHIGENSWITKEEGGRQKVYAKDAAGNAIPIDYTNGTKLLINGRDVDQAIDNVGALSAALTGLPTIPQDSPLSCGIGAGAHSGSKALSGGCASKVNERLTFNAAASFIPANQEYQGTDNSWSGRVGFVFKLGKITKPTLISMKEKKALQKKVESLTSKNKSIEDKNNELENRLALQNERLEKLEQIALGLTSSTDLVSIAP